MDYAANSPIAAGASRTFLASALDGLKALYRRQASYLRTTGELKELTDRELADLGFNRADISAIARTASRSA
ncbi:DUF1127 domain-containing protein [Tropicimonas sediminicola]|uniref:Uncharacterized conserved protein YjiS, DUF1127 family n=1 Tax=Tropicimonas sediminicola TaxID=1031541 RepID=A0A239GPU7_9RHOB|nr:DUF1127 domain-containing protein [Tropicimonas sediminicola]SNS71150.1 Uncharacterized conserved protein YjiS, DUF1127 family [Tropicimonas sediminicola]